jgi:hypothetical protein
MALWWSCCKPLLLPVGDAASSSTTSHNSIIPTPTTISWSPASICSMW